MSRTNFFIRFHLAIYRLLLMDFHKRPDLGAKKNVTIKIVVITNTMTTPEGKL